MAEKYIEEGFIARGSCGYVYKVKSVTSGTYYALKVHIKHEYDNSEDRLRYGVDFVTVREMSCLSALKGHHRVIQLLDCFIYKNSLATLMPYMPYVLSQAICHRTMAKDKPLSFVAHFSTQVAEALSYMHGLNIVHRDLTPNNVLLTEDLDVKVADMGIARQACVRMTPSMCAEYYRAPEAYSQGDQDDRCSKYTCAIDMWSLGAIMVNVMEDEIVFRGRRINGCYRSGYDIVRKTLCPEDHPLAMYEPWDPVIVMPNVVKCAVAKKRIFKLLAFEYSERLSASELLKDTEWTLLAEMTSEEKARMIRVLCENKILNE